MLTGIWILYGMSLNLLRPNYLSTDTLFRILPIVATGNLLILTFAQIGHYGILMFNDKKRASEELLAQKLATAEAELALVKSSIHPHFLFNSLSMLRSLVRSDPVTAGRALENLSEFLVFNVTDDEPHNRERLSVLLAQIPDVTIIAQCRDGFETVGAVQKDPPDLLFLDINMPRLSGFDVLELLGPVAPPVVFVTAFDEHALKAFETSAIDYVLKPVNAQRIEKSIAKFLATGTYGNRDYSKFLEERRAGAPPLDRILIKDSRRIHIVSVEGILYIKAEDDYVCIITKDAQFVKQERISTLENNLDKTHFCRVHRSYILNLRHVARLDPSGRESYEAVLRNGAKVPVSAAGFRTLPWLNRQKV